MGLGARGWKYEGPDARPLMAWNRFTWSHVSFPHGSVARVLDKATSRQQHTLRTLHIQGFLSSSHTYQ